MSKNIRDLYKKKGKSLAKGEEDSKTKSKIHIAKGISEITSRGQLSSDMKLKILKIQRKHNLSEKSYETENNHSSYNMNQLQFEILDFGLNYQRINGQSITKIKEFYTEFKKLKRVNLDFSKFTFVLLEMNKNGLISYQNEEEILFEPLETSGDINRIFELISPEGKLSYEGLQRKLHDWSQTKIDNAIGILETEGIILRDDDSIWFPQLQK